ncbi:MAG: ferredoxin reductase family protein [Armatimonadota bacterium]
MNLRRFVPHFALLCLLVVTTAAPLLLVPLNEPSAHLNQWKLLAKIGSLCGTILMVWQFLLGYRQAAARWVDDDYLWTIKIHKWAGVAAGLLVPLHPLFIALYYADKWRMNLFFGGLPWPLSLFVPLGVIALIVLAGIVLTSTLWRKRLGREVWFSSHLSSYVLLPLVLIHGYVIGNTVGTTGLRYVWQGMFVLVALFYLLRLLAARGAFSARYEVIEAKDVADDVVEISLKPLGRPLRPRPAQFAFFRRESGGATRPFTISRYVAETGEIEITVKAEGPTTTALQEVQLGERFRVDGPYGTFGQQAFKTDRPILMLAGGIGITPFRRMIQELEALPDREAYLFYGNKYEKDIAHRAEIEATDEVDLIHVLSEVEEHDTFHTGRITLELLTSHLSQPLDRYECFICGPPAMIKSLEADLHENHVPPRQVHHELFEY